MYCLTFGFKSYPTTVCPFDSTARADGRPSLPSPTNPIFDILVITNFDYLYLSVYLSSRISVVRKIVHSLPERVKRLGNIIPVPLTRNDGAYDSKYASLLYENH